MNKTEIIAPDAKILKKIHSLKSKKGKFVAIEPISKKWFFGNNLLEALKNAKEVFPDRIFYFERVGYKAAGMLK
jgi:hypothetical protein